MAFIHIAHVVHSFGIGGLENGIVNLINRMDASRFRFSIYSFVPLNDSLERITEGRVAFDVLHKRAGNDWRLPFKLAHRFEANRVDVVHTHGWGTYLEGFLGAKLAGIPVLIHGEHGLGLLDRWSRILVYKTCIHATDQILTVSEDLRARFVMQYKICTHKVKAIVNGVDWAKFKPDSGKGIIKRQELGLADHHVVIGTVGRLCFEKNHETLLHAMSLVIACVPEVRLLIVGDGPLREKLVQLSQELGIKKYVHFLGRRDDVPELLNAMDIFALTSVSEGMPNTVLEAMCVRLPVVATDVGGIPEIILAGDTGFLVPPQQVEMIAKDLVKLANSPELRFRMGESGYERVKMNFSMEKMVEAYEHTYIDFIERKNQNKRNR